MKNTKRTLATTHAHVKTHTSHSYACASNKRTPKHKLIYTHALVHCKYLYTGDDGGPCLACSAGKYKSVNGSAACSTCPLNTNSSAASMNQSDCKCNPGYTGEDEHPRQTRHKHSQPHMHNTQIQIRTYIYTTHTPK